MTLRWEVREEKRGGGGLTSERRQLAGLVGGRLPTERLRVEAVLEQWVDANCLGRRGGSGHRDLSSRDLRKRKEEVRPGH
jgi:hypothetical protein